MRLKALFLLFSLALCLFFLDSCSRESSIKENVNLRNNHSVVFVQRAPFKDAQAFADSITNLPNPDSVIVSDTITVTVNDTIYMMGFLRYYADKIYLYQWILDSLTKDDSGKETLKKAMVTSHNATPQSWVYQKEGVYSPLFVAIDGNSATDTAGKDQYIRVINTPPYLGIDKNGDHHDTLWTKAETPITFPILALDSFGTIKSFKVDLDASGKKEPKEWKYEKSKTSDSILVTIPYDKNLTDTLGNQKIYLMVTDDDGNTTTDSVVIHFNQKPTIEILGPNDEARIADTSETVRLSFEAHDKDNEQDLRYYVRIAETPADQNSDIDLSNVYDLVMENSLSTYFSVIENYVNNLKNKGFKSYYFSWDVWVTDGYDTVVVDKIKLTNGKERPRWFYLGPNPSQMTGTFTGVAKYQGLSNHSGIKVTLVNAKDATNSYTATTAADGSYTIDGVPAGTYTVTATDESGRKFKDATATTKPIKAGDNAVISELLLKDPAAPTIYGVQGIEDEMTVRSFTITGRFSDEGSQVKTATATLDGTALTFSNLAVYGWTLELKNLTDGDHVLKMVVTDSAGLSNEFTRPFAVKATSLAITVNGGNSAMVGEAIKLSFVAKIEDANPPITKITWQTNIEGMKAKTVDVVDGSAKIEFTKQELEQQGLKIDANVRYTMTASGDQGSSSNTVRFGFYKDGPMVAIEAPSSDTTITLNDVINIKTTAVGNNSNGSNDYTLTWTCIDGTKTTANCLTANNLTPQISWTTAGTKKVIAKVVNNDGKNMSDTLIVNVIVDAPTISTSETKTTIDKKTNSSHEFEVVAKDKYGTIQEIAISCGTNAYTPVSITPAKQITTTVTAKMPNTATSKYRCIVRAKDDDSQYGYDTLYFNVIKDIPKVQLEIHKKDVTIKDVETIKYSASNIFKTPIYLNLACNTDLKNLSLESRDQYIIWQTTSNGTSALVTVPDKASTYYCVLKAYDSSDESLYALDTVTYKVYYARPSVTVNEYFKKTIKDVVSLTANAQDSAVGTSYGSIVSYEWGCGPSSNKNIALTKTNKNTYDAVMPETAQTNYLCIVQVTDDDGLTARDTTKFTVELAPPTITITDVKDTRKKMDASVKIRAGQDIYLYAEAEDTYEGTMGYIAKREWSCGANDAAIASNWKEVSSYDTTWTAPQASVDFRCVARATDDDGNVVTATIKLEYSTKLPVISVAETKITIAEGEVFLLNATVNEVWQGINWFSWQCFYEDTKKAAESLVKYDYYINNKSFYDYRETLSNEGRDLYCVVSAEEKSSKTVYRDTSHIKIITQENMPVGKITAADTIFPWSGDEAQSGYAVYYYTPEWGGTESVIGVIGDEARKNYYWQFSNVGSGFYQGRTDGTLDTNIAEFNYAFVRPTYETEISMCLDFRDSTIKVETLSFLKKHQAETTCRKIYVRRAWNNIGSDTVFSHSTVRTPPAITVLNNKPIVAYLTGKTTIESKYSNGKTWTAISAAGISATDSIVSVKLTNNGTDAYMAVLTSGSMLNVYKSAGGTSAWASVGTSITSVTSMNIAMHPTSGVPVVSYVKNNYPYFNYLDKNTWETKQISTSLTAREVNVAFSSTGIMVIAFTDNSYLYKTYYAIYSATYNQNLAPALIAQEMNSVSMATDGSTIYMGYLNRSSVTGVAGPYVKIGTIGTSKITWSSESNLQQGILATNINLAARNGKAYAIIDDNGRGFSHCHAFYFNSKNWTELGENQLPYFKGTFYSTHKYNLYGFAPTIVTSAGDGKVYISMIAWEGTGGRGVNNGPIFMKYIADNWTINTKP